MSASIREQVEQNSPLLTLRGREETSPSELTPTNLTQQLKFFREGSHSSADDSFIEHHLSSISDRLAAIAMGKRANENFSDFSLVKEAWASIHDAESGVFRGETAMERNANRKLLHETTLNWY